MRIRRLWIREPQLGLLTDSEAAGTLPEGPVHITLNGEPYTLDAPLSVGDLLARLAIDRRRVAVEHNTLVVRRAAYDDTVVHEGDEIEIVNFVGGG
jgi:sulfur carrier protein